MGVALNASRSSRSFHASARSFIQVGDKLPNLDVLVENSPGNKVNLSEAIKGKALIIGVPAAFSPSCSNSHVPGYINHKNLKSAGDVFVVAVNDPFVTKAWADLSILPVVQVSASLETQLPNSPRLWTWLSMVLPFSVVHEASVMPLRLRTAKSRHCTSSQITLGWMFLPPRRFWVRFTSMRSLRLSLRSVR